MASNRDVAHAWANQTGRQKNGSHMFYDGPRIFSYGRHFEIARIVGDVVLFTSRSYSVSTAKHKGYVRSAINNQTVFTVPDFDDYNASAKYYAQQCDELRVQATRARGNAEFYRNELNGTINQALAFVVRFKKEISAENRKALGKWFKQQKDGTLFSAAELAKIKERVAKDRAAKVAQTARNKKENEERAAKAIEKLDAWARGESNELPGYSWDLQLPTRLRINGKRIETSRGAQITLRAAFGLWDGIRTGADVVGMDLDGFRVNSWDGETLTVGCHKLQAQELDKLAAVLKLPARAVTA